MKLSESDKVFFWMVAGYVVAGVSNLIFKFTEPMFITWVWLSLMVLYLVYSHKK